MIDHAKRAAGKDMMEELVQLIDSHENKTITQAELLAYLERFAANPPAAKLEKIAADDTAGEQIKKRFWDYGDVFCPNSAMVLRKPTDSDLGGFLQLQREYTLTSSFLNDEGYCAAIWREHKANTALMLSITQNGEYIGYCGIKDLAKNPWEIAIELLPQWTHQGMGSAALRAMLDVLADRLSMVEFRVRIAPANTASQQLFEKLSAQPNGISKLILKNEQECRQFEEENLHLIDNALIAVAKKFGVEPRKLLSHVLDYTLSWNSQR